MQYLIGHVRTGINSYEEIYSEVGFLPRRKKTMKRYKAVWVGENPFEGDLGYECSQVVEVTDTVTIEQLEKLAKEVTPKGYVFHHIELTTEEISKKMRYEK